MKPTIREIDHVVIRTAEPAAMARFYCEALGCTVEKEQPDIGLTQLRAGRSMIDLLAVGSPIDRSDSGTPGTGRNVDHVCLRVEHYDAAQLSAHLIAHAGAARRRGADTAPDGFGQSLYLFDPEGNMVELQGPPNRRERLRYKRKVTRRLAWAAAHSSGAARLEDRPL